MKSGNGDIKTSLSQVRNGGGQIHMQLKLKGFLLFFEIVL